MEMKRGVDRGTPEASLLLLSLTFLILIQYRFREMSDSRGFLPNHPAAVPSGAAQVLFRPLVWIIIISSICRCWQNWGSEPSGHLAIDISCLWDYGPEVQRGCSKKES